MILIVLAKLCGGVAEGCAAINTLSAGACSDLKNESPQLLLRLGSLRSALGYTADNIKSFDVNLMCQNSCKFRLIYLIARDGEFVTCYKHFVRSDHIVHLF